MTSSLPISDFALITSNLADRIPSTQAKSNLDADDDYFSTTYSDGLTDLIKPSLRGSLDDGDRNDSCIGSSLYKTESHISQSLDSLIFSGQGDTSRFVQRSVSGYNKLSGSHGVNSFSLENLSLSSGIEPLTLRELMAGDCQLSNHVYPTCNGIDAKISGHSWKRPRLSFDQ
ncbi:unnamed protein product [Calicophoron daubneyi]